MRKGFLRESHKVARQHIWKHWKIGNFMLEVQAEVPYEVVKFALYQSKYRFNTFQLCSEFLNQAFKHKIRDIFVFLIQKEILFLIFQWPRYDFAVTDANAEDWANTFYFCEADGKRVVGTCDYDPKKYWIVIRKCSNFTFLA